MCLRGANAAPIVYNRRMGMISVGGVGIDVVNLVNTFSC